MVAVAGPCVGGGGDLGPFPTPADPPTHIRKVFLSTKIKLKIKYQRGLKLEVNFKYTNLF